MVKTNKRWAVFLFKLTIKLHVAQNFDNLRKKALFVLTLPNICSIIKIEYIYNEIFSMPIRCIGRMINLLYSAIILFCKFLIRISLCFQEKVY